MKEILGTKMIENHNDGGVEASTSKTRNLGRKRIMKPLFNSSRETHGGTPQSPESTKYSDGTAVRFGNCQACQFWGYKSS